MVRIIITKALVYRVWAKKNNRLIYRTSGFSTAKVYPYHYIYETLPRSNETVY
jgi:hypothetical protein